MKTRRTAPPPSLTASAIRAYVNELRARVATGEGGWAPPREGDPYYEGRQAGARLALEIVEDWIATRCGEEPAEPTE